jgi:predicted ATPase
MRFTRVRLENWRNFTAVDVGIQRRAFLVGPNASGKSNLLDALRFLHDVASVGGGFQDAVGRRGGVTRLRSLAARRFPNVSINVEIGDGDGGTAWGYELRFTEDKRRRPQIARERVVRDGREVSVRPDEKDTADPERLTQTYLEQVHANEEFREIAEFLGSIRYLHLVPQLVREPDRYIRRDHDPFGSGFLEEIARTPEKTRKARFRRIRDALRVAVPQLSELELERDARGTPHLRGKYEHWRPQGAWQSEDQFSDGTLRLLGLLWASLDGTGPLLLEEPELSLHPEVVRFVPQMFARIQRNSGRQILLSTHSADLLRDQGIGLDEGLLLQPAAEGTTVAAATDFKEIRRLLEGGISLGDAVMPRTRPRHAGQLMLFGS